MEYPNIKFKRIERIHNCVYFTTYICLLPQKYDRYIQKAKSLLVGKLKK